MIGVNCMFRFVLCDFFVFSGVVLRVMVVGELIGKVFVLMSCLLMRFVEVVVKCCCVSDGVWKLVDSVLCSDSVGLVI